MPRKGYCSYCRSVQPLGEYREDGQAASWCETCRNPIEDTRVEKPAARPRPPTILCIDDDRIVLSYCSDALELHGFRTLVASDGPSGIEIAKKDLPDLILLDIMMPGMTGLEVCRRLRSEPGFRNTPIILLTASDDPDLGHQGREAGANSTMRKPFGVANIINAIERVLDRRVGPQGH
jgi:CheY-like chemotaxis protein